MELDQNTLALYAEYEKAFFKDESIRSLNIIDRTSQRIEVGERTLAQIPLPQSHSVYREIAYYLSLEYDERGLYRTPFYHRDGRFKDNSGAISDYSRAIQLLRIDDKEPDRDLYRRRCECYLYQKMPADALSDAELVLQIKEDVDAYILRSQCFQMLGSYAYLYKKRNDKGVLKKISSALYNLKSIREKLDIPELKIIIDSLTGFMN